MASASYGRTRLADGGRSVILPPQALILRFRVELLDTDPLVWLRQDSVQAGGGAAGLVASAACDAA